MFVDIAIRSALAQDYPHLEVIVADDCSTDATRDVAERFASDGRFRYVCNKKNIGRVANYKNCLENLANGSWFINLDGDDYFVCDSYISKAVELTRRDPGIALVFGKVRKSGMGAADEVLNADWPYPSIIDGTDFFVRHPPFGPNGNIAPYHLSALFDRAKAISLDFYRADILSSDFESLYRLMIGTKIGFVDEVAAVWRQHDNNATRQVQHEQLRDNLRLFQSLFEYASKTELGGLIDLRAWLRRRLARAWLGHSIELVSP